MLFYSAKVSFFLYYSPGHEKKKTPLWQDGAKSYRWEKDP
jgi:hypothetical protein